MLLRDSKREEILSRRHGEGGIELPCPLQASQCVHQPRIFLNPFDRIFMETENSNHLITWFGAFSILRLSRSLQPPINFLAYRRHITFQVGKVLGALRQERREGTEFEGVGKKTNRLWTWVWILSLPEFMRIEIFQPPWAFTPSMYAWSPTNGSDTVRSPGWQVLWRLSLNCLYKAPLLIVFRCLECPFPLLCLCTSLLTVAQVSLTCFMSLPSLTPLGKMHCSFLWHRCIKPCPSMAHICLCHHEWSTDSPSRQ